MPVANTPRAVAAANSRPHAQFTTLPSSAPSVPPGAEPSRLPSSSPSSLLELRHPDDQLAGLSWRNLAAAIALGLGESLAWR